MPQVAIDHVEVRWRPAGTQAAWTSAKLLPGQSCVTVSGVVRGLTYEVEARSVGVNGSASAWAQRVHTVTSVDNNPLAPTSLVAVSNLGGVVLSWQIPTGQPAIVQYVPERCGDSSGAPDGNWMEMQTVSGNTFIDTSVSASIYWYRVRATNTRGTFSAYTAAVSIAPASASSTSVMSAITLLVNQGRLSESILPA